MLAAWLSHVKQVDPDAFYLYQVPPCVLLSCLPRSLCDICAAAAAAAVAAVAAAAAAAAVNMRQHSLLAHGLCGSCRHAPSV